MIYKFKTNYIIALLLILFLNNFASSSETNLKCDDSFIDNIYKYDDNNFEYLEDREDAGIFYDFDWDNDNKKIIIKRNKDHYPIVKFSLFETEKVEAGKTSIKKINSVDLSKLTDDEIDKLSYLNGLVKFELYNGENLEIISKPYKLNNFKLSNFQISSIHNIDTSKGILEMSFNSIFTNIRKDFSESFKHDEYLLDDGLHNICDDFRTLNLWPLESVEFDEFRYDADVREGLKNKEKLINPVFEITADDKVIRTYRSEKGVGFFRQSFNFRKFPFDTQKLIIRIKSGVGNFKYQNLENEDKVGSVTFINPEPGAFLNLSKFFNPDVNKLKQWKILDNGISIKNKTIFDNNYYDVFEKKIIRRSENVLDIEIIIKRNFQHYLLKIMLPVFLILCVAWYVLWIPTEKYEARLNTSIIALLALIAYNFVFQDDIPKLEYLTNLDWFILLSYIFCCIPVYLSIAFSKFISKNQKKVSNVNKFIKIWGGLLYLALTFQIFFF